MALADGADASFWEASLPSYDDDGRHGGGGGGGPGGGDAEAAEFRPSKGLTTAEAERLLERWGRNELEERTTPAWLIVLRLARSPPHPTPPNPTNTPLHSTPLH